MLKMFGTPDFTPFGEFISPIHYVYITEFVSVGTIFSRVCLLELVGLLCLVLCVISFSEDAPL